MEERAYNDIYQMLRGPFSGFFLKRVGGDADSAEELAGQTLAEALQALRDGKYKPHQAKFVTFAYGVAHNVWRRYVYPRPNREVPFSALSKEGLAQIKESLMSTDGFLPPLEEIEAMQDCLRAEDTPLNLTPEERFVIIGRANGETFRELAKKQRCALSTVHDRNRCGIEKLRKGMAKKGYR